MKKLFYLIMVVFLVSCGSNNPLAPKGDKGDPGSNGTNGENGNDGVQGPAGATSKIIYTGTLDGTGAVSVSGLTNIDVSDMPILEVYAYHPTIASGGPGWGRQQSFIVTNGFVVVPASAVYANKPYKAIIVR